MICKWCRRLEGEHDPQHGDYRCVIQDDWVEDTSPSSSLLYLIFEPDDSPTGKLIAAALHDADEIRAAKRDQPDLVPVKDPEQWRMSPEYGNALIEIHEAENGGGDE